MKRILPTLGSSDPRLTDSFFAEIYVDDEEHESFGSVFRPTAERVDPALGLQLRQETTLALMPHQVTQVVGWLLEDRGNEKFTT